MVRARVRGKFMTISFNAKQLEQCLHEAGDEDRTVVTDNLAAMVTRSLKST